MKKALFAFLALSLVAFNAFADISNMFSIGSSGRAFWIPAVTSGVEGDDEIYSSLAQSWGSGTTEAPRVQVSVRGDSDNVSYKFDVNGNGDGIGVGNNAYIEARPFSKDFPVQAALAVGKTYMNETRIDAVYGMYNWYRLGSVNSTYVVDQEGFIFPSLLDHGNDGRTLATFAARLYPVEGLTIGVGVPAPYNPSALTTAQAIWQDANAYIAYKIGNIGKISVGYDGKKISATSSSSSISEYDKYWAVINAAFELTAVENLYIAIGGKIPTKEATGDTSDGGEAIQVNAYAKYSLADIAPLTFHVLFGSKIMEWDDTSRDGRGNNDGFGFQVGVGVDWEVVENVPIFLDVRYANGVYMNQSSADKTDSVSVGVGVSKKWANGELGVAFELATHGYGRAYGYSPTDRDPDSLAWAVPVKFAYNF